MDSFIGRTFTIKDFFETKADYFCNDVIKDKKKVQILILKDLVSVLCD